MEMGAEEASFPDTQENLQDNARKVLIKQAAVWFRIDGLLDRLLTALKHLAALIVRMENRIPRGPSDYANENSKGIYVDYRGPTPPEPSWQTTLLGKIVAPLIVIGIPAILAALWSMNSLLWELRGDNKMIVQRQDALDEHLKSTDRQVEEIKTALWPHKH
jgi:hypothetical protein